MCASCWFAVITRGLEITSPVPSACIADSSSSSKVPNGSFANATASVPAGLLPGRLTLNRLVSSEVPSIILEILVELPDSKKPSLLPPSSLRTPAVFRLRPQRTPMSLLKSSEAITMRDSIKTCRIGTSSRCTSARMSAS